MQRLAFLRCSDAAMQGVASFLFQSWLTTFETTFANSYPCQEIIGAKELACCDCDPISPLQIREIPSAVVGCTPIVDGQSMNCANVCQGSFSWILKSSNSSGVPMKSLVFFSKSSEQKSCRQLLPPASCRWFQLASHPPLAGPTGELKKCPKETITLKRKQVDHASYIYIQ